MGAGQGFGGTVINGLGNGSSISLLGVRGDIEVDSIVLTDVPIFTSHLPFQWFMQMGIKEDLPTTVEVRTLPVSQNSHLSLVEVMVELWNWV